MKGTVLLVLFAIVLFSIAPPLSLAAQNPDRFEVFGGYSYTTFSIFDRYSGPWQRFGYNGWEAAVAATLVPHLAVEGDFAGGFSNPNGNSSTVRTFMGGPRIFGNFGKASVYAHVLVGEVSFAVGGAVQRWQLPPAAAQTFGRPATSEPGSFSSTICTPASSLLRFSGTAPLRTARTTSEFQPGLFSASDGSRCDAMAKLSLRVSKQTDT